MDTIPCGHGVDKTTKNGSIKLTQAKSKLAFSRGKWSDP
jgi:hypothetical protein